MTPVFWLTGGLLMALIGFWIVSWPDTFKTHTEFSGRVSYIIDGDTLILDGHKPKIRLWGVDAPETGRTGAKAATAYLFTLAQSQRITCRKMTTDRYGRTVARCFLPDGREINRLMIDSPHAKEYRRFTKGFYNG